MSHPEHLETLSSVLQSGKCKELLGLESARAELYPSSPAAYLRITYSAIDNESESANAQDTQNISEETAESATKNWVKNFLGRYRLCPYTSSASRAAVGLSSVGVPVGGVHVRVANTTTGSAQQQSKQSSDVLRAAELVSLFWSEVVTLMHSPEEEWATSLVVFPEYDDEFESFVEICDSIVEPTVVATEATKHIGRAWFHPQYDAEGHSEVIAGHAVPHKMVEGFMQSLHASGTNGDESLLAYDELVEANNRVRRTPHATINILRRSQLNAAAEYEKGLGEKRPKANSIYVRNARRLSEAKKELY
ncbi:hypothetical protein ACHAXT_005218 [Thalassiosira profunda]